MEKQIDCLKKKKNIWISLTGYRSLVVLKALIEKNRTIAELTEILKENKITSKSVSKDTVRLTVNTLKSAGCNITRPSKSNNYTYELLSHPFKLKISDEELQALIKLREKLSEESDKNEILTFNDICEKIVSLTEDKCQFALIKETEPFANANKKLLKTFSNPNLKNKRIKIVYNSAEKGDEEIDIIFKDITFETGKLYLNCYLFKYNSHGVLNFERIKEIKTIGLTNEIQIARTYDVEYSITGSSVINYEKEKYETIINQSNDKIIIRAEVENEFLFIQRLLLFGSDFKIISPDFFREKLINKIKKIQKEYQK